jgi:transposase
VKHESLQPGDACPSCGKGTVYETGRPGVLVRLVGQAPIQAKVYELQKLRCNLCGEVFTAPAPEGVGSEKYDATSGSMIALLKYGSGMPFNRNEGLQGSLGVPLPASTQWEIVWAKAEKIAPAYEELIRQAAQGDVVYNDDTTVKILEFMGARAKEQALAEEAEDDSAQQEVPKRRGLFTSGVVSTRDGRRIALFFSGRKHAGENLKDVLVRRTNMDGDSMCDASRAACRANCRRSWPIAWHWRRRFVEWRIIFPKCRRLGIVGGGLSQRRGRSGAKLSPSAAALSSAQSGPVMGELHAWLYRQLNDRLVEPNSSLGTAISYMLKHWTA